jgi:outer membrane protein OmpA-like peptidoglycan-associated protein
MVTTPGPRDQAELARAAERLRANPQVRRVRIEAHADAVERNPQALSQARADAVRAFLIARGVEPDRLQAVGYGNTRPVDRRKTAEARARNRRVELVIVEQQ